MPRGKHLRGVSKKEQRQYEHIKESAETSGRYGKRAKEVAARTVLKQHKKKATRKGAEYSCHVSIERQPNQRHAHVLIRRQESFEGFPPSLLPLRECACLAPLPTPGTAGAK
jgi:hypothetical protein